MSRTDGTKMTFSEALEALKEGNQCLRKGWNGKGMWLEVLTPEPTGPEMPKYALTNPFIVIKGTDDTLAPWVPSQADLFADDWEVWCDECGNKGHFFIDRKKRPCGACASAKVTP